jgi:hypothetical protein
MKGTSSSFQSVLDLFTKDHTMVIPAGIMAGGNEYFYLVRAFLIPSVDFTVAPYHSAFPWSHADLLSPVVSTAGATGSSIVSIPDALQHVLYKPAGAPTAGRPVRLAPRIVVKAPTN